MFNYSTLFMTLPAEFPTANEEDAAPSSDVTTAQQLPMKDFQEQVWI